MTTVSDNDDSTSSTSHMSSNSKKRSPPFEIRHVTYIAQAAVPLISFDFLLHNSPASSVGYNKTSTNVKVDLLFVRLPIPGPLPSSDLLPLDDDVVLVGMDSASVKGLNGVRSASMILSMVDCPNTRVYLDALRIVR
jgi:poly(A) polymerase Pap1